MALSVRVCQGQYSTAGGYIEQSMKRAVWAGKSMPTDWMSQFSVGRIAKRLLSRKKARKTPLHFGWKEPLHAGEIAGGNIVDGQSTAETSPC